MFELFSIGVDRVMFAIILTTFNLDKKWNLIYSIQTYISSNCWHTNHYQRQQQNEHLGNNRWTKNSYYSVYLFSSIVHHVLFLIQTKRRTDLISQDKLKRNVVLSLQEEKNELNKPILLRVQEDNRQHFMNANSSQFMYSYLLLNKWAHGHIFPFTFYNCWAFSAP